MFIYRLYRSIYKFHGHLIPSHTKQVVDEWWEWWTCNLEAVRGGSNPTVGKIFCNVHLFRVPRSCAGSVQMKSSITFIRGNRCIEREKDNFKSREVKRLKECALALSDVNPRNNQAKTDEVSTSYQLTCGQAYPMVHHPYNVTTLFPRLFLQLSVLGTPAEEGMCGKADLIRMGAFTGMDAAMMAHPSQFTLTRTKYTSMTP